MYTLASDHKLIKHTDACVMDLEDMIRMYHDMPYINCALGIHSTHAVGLADLNLTVSRSPSQVFSPLNLASNAGSVPILMTNLFDL